jgi:hypothetical protein
MDKIGQRLAEENTREYNSKNVLATKDF